MKEFLIGLMAGLIMLAFWVPALFTALDLW